jgi:hypothetical protein
MSGKCKTHREIAVALQELGETAREKQAIAKLLFKGRHRAAAGALHDLFEEYSPEKADVLFSEEFASRGYGRGPGQMKMLAYSAPTWNAFHDIIRTKPIDWSHGGGVEASWRRALDDLVLILRRSSYAPPPAVSVISILTMSLAARAGGRHVLDLAKSAVERLTPFSDRPFIRRFGCALLEFSRNQGVDFASLTDEGSAQLECHVSFIFSNVGFGPHMVPALLTDGNLKSIAAASSHPLASRRVLERVVSRIGSNGAAYRSWPLNWKVMNCTAMQTVNRITPATAPRTAAVRSRLLTSMEQHQRDLCDHEETRRAYLQLQARLFELKKIDEGRKG